MMNMEFSVKSAYFWKFVKNFFFEDQNIPIQENLKFLDNSDLPKNYWIRYGHFND